MWMTIHGWHTDQCVAVTPHPIDAICNERAESNCVVTHPILDISSHHLTCSPPLLYCLLGICPFGCYLICLCARAP
jgi:hypothetical protein